MDFAESYPDTSSSTAIAVRRGDLAALREMVLDKGKSCQLPDNRGWRPIHEAAYWNQSDCLSFLVQIENMELNAPTFEGETPLWIAARNNSIEATKILLQAGALVNIPNHEEVTPLHYAASKGFKEITQLLIENGANINMEDCGGYTPLHEAAIAGHLSIVELLLAKGVNKWAQDCHQRTPLFCGCQSHSCAIVRLLAHDSSPAMMNLKAIDGATAVMVASQSGCIDCVRLLVEEHGADPNLKANDAVMAIHLALTSNHKEVLEYLLGITDYSFVEQSCLLPIHKHLTSSGSLPCWDDWHNTDLESVNIFTLAITYDRHDFIEVLLDGGLEPDRFPSQWAFDGNLARSQFGTKYKWATPISFLSSHPPFEKNALKAFRLLIDSGCCLGAHRPLYVPPLIALCSASGWGNEAEFPSLSQALEYLIVEYEKHPIKLANVAEWMRSALILNPRVFMILLQRGYPFDETVLVDTATALHTLVSSLSEGLVGLTPAHSQILSALLNAGFRFGINNILKETSSVPSLKHLSRKAVMSSLRRPMEGENTIIPVSKMELPLPRCLINYLCYDDIHL